MMQSMLEEMELRKTYIEEEKISSIYFGGGTPSILAAEDIERFIERINQLHPLENNIEITLEANPDDINEEKLNAWKKAGINRLSIGIQSFNQNELHLLKRAHTAIQAIEAVKNAQDKGFHNLSLDLIYAIPNQTDETWLSNLNKIVELDVPHLSCYALTIEEKTELHYLINKKKCASQDEEMVERHFILLHQWAANNGFLAYEISNFCKPGKEAVHNSNYWKGNHYIGIGPSAHSYNKTSRQWNLSSNAAYIKQVRAKTSWFETEILTPTQKFNEHLLTGLRTSKGVNLEEMRHTFGADFSHDFEKGILAYTKSGLIQNNNGNIVLSLKGRLLSDHIIGNLFRTEDE